MIIIFLNIFTDSNNESIIDFIPSYSADYCKIAKDTYAIQLDNHSYILKFKSIIGNKIMINLNIMHYKLPTFYSQ